jgi:hypothetical protein
MTQELKTLREAALAINGLKEAIDGKITLLIWVVGGLGAAGLVVSAGLFFMLNDLSKSVTRLEPQGVILLEIRDTLERIAPPADTGKSPLE